MPNSDENACHPVNTKIGLFVKSPISKSFDQGIDTPQKLPVAPHPSPINMVTESCNPKSKEIFRSELLKACLLKIPEAVADESVFNEYISTRRLSPSEDLISDLADSPQGQCLLRQHKKAKLESNWIAENETPTDSCAVFNNVKDLPVNFNPKHYSKLCETVNLENNPDESTSANVNYFDGKSECSRNVNSFHFGNNDGVNRMVFYDHTTDHQNISRLLNVNSEWNDHSDSIFGGRSPRSDMSTVAVCGSDTSDISDEDLSTRSVDLHDIERSVNRPSNPSKKKSKSVVRRFLNWRRSLKFRKRAASLDESNFPFLANRFDSYKTEFELSV